MDQFWTCERCKHGNKAEAPHTRDKGCRFAPERNPYPGKAPPAPPPGLEQPAEAPRHEEQQPAEVPDPAPKPASSSDLIQDHGQPDSAHKDPE